MGAKHEWSGTVAPILPAYEPAADAESDNRRGVPSPAPVPLSGAAWKGWKWRGPLGIHHCLVIVFLFFLMCILPLWAEWRNGIFGVQTEGSINTTEINAVGGKFVAKESDNNGDDGCPCRRPQPPQYFQTTDGAWAGPTATGKAPFMAQTRTFEGTYVPNAPLQTSVPVVGENGNQSIFEMMGCVLLLMLTAGSLFARE